MKSAICIGAHPDDIEFSMGGTVAKLVAEDYKVRFIDITNGEPTPFGSVEKRAQESKKAAEILGAERYTLTHPNRYLFDDVEIRKEIANHIREIKPSVMFIHYPTDAHPDHWAAHQLSMASRFYGKLSKSDMVGDRHYTPRIFYFFSVHLKIAPQPSFCINISEHIEKKLEAVTSYESQFQEIDKRVKSNDDSLTKSGLLRHYTSTQSSYWGTKIGCAHAEPFYSPEIIALKSFESILP